MKQFEALDENEIHSHFHEIFELRFHETVDIKISHLSYIFTSEGLSEYRQSGCADKEELLDTFTTFITEAFENEFIQENYLIACFEYYLDQVDFKKGRAYTRFWKSMINFEFYEPELNDGNKISFSIFAKIALTFITLPATEAIAESCFSCLRKILNDYNKSTNEDLFLTRSKTKMAIRYNRGIMIC